MIRFGFLLYCFEDLSLLKRNHSRMMNRQTALECPARMPFKRRFDLGMLMAGFVVAPLRSAPYASAIASDAQPWNKPPVQKS